MRFQLFLVGLFGSLLSNHSVISQDNHSQIDIDDIEINRANYSAWRDHILPVEREMSWNRIPWLTTFKNGILAANREQKPLLLWTMNGHPLGCT